MANVSDLRLITLLPTENQTIYAFNVNNVNEFYTESFFARDNTTWGFCVVPKRNNNAEDCWINIVQSDNQVVTLNAIIPDIAIDEELRAGVLNYYLTNLPDKYIYTVRYQNIRVFATAVVKTELEVNYKFLDIEQSDHQLILLVSESGATYSYGVSLAENTHWKAVLIAEPGYKPGHLTIRYTTSGSIVDLEDGEIAEDYVNFDLEISASPAEEIYLPSIFTPGLFDTSDTEHSNSDGYIRIGVGTDVSKKIQTILLYTRDKMESDYIELGTDPSNMLFAPTGTADNEKATRLVLSNNTRNQYVLSSLDGYYGFDYILGYSQAIPESALRPNSFHSDTTIIDIVGFGFGCEKAPVNDASKGYWFLIINPPSTPSWTYMKFMLFNGKKKFFSMIASKDYFEEITEGQFIGQLIYKQGSKQGINDDAYLQIKSEFDKGGTINVGVCIL